MYQFKVFVRLFSLLFISVFYINGAHALGSESTKKAATAHNPPHSLMRDLNADGILDFITTHSKLGGVTVALGLGNGNFEHPLNYLTGRKSLTVRIRDFNSDNNLDLVAYNHKRKMVTVLLGDGNGGFTDQKTFRMNPAPAAAQPTPNTTDPSSSASVTAVAPAAVSATAVTGIAALEQSIHQKINAYRASRGLTALSLNATISNVARTHSQNMASGTVPFGHQGFDTRVQTLSKTFTFRSAGENVAYNFGFSDPATTAVDGWLKSQGHLNNIIGAYNLTGIGVARNSKGEYYFTQIFWRQ